MRNQIVGAILVLLVGLAAARGSANVDIVVDLGEYSRAERAATDEANVGWHDGDPKDDIVCTHAFAATELQHYLRKATGDDDDFSIYDDDARIPEHDLILIGGPDSNAVTAKMRGRLNLSRDSLNGVGREGYIIKTGESGSRRVLVIAGGGRVGTLYGTYDLLHRLGCRWFAPGELHEEIPDLGMDRVPEMDVREAPAFQTRGFHAWEDRGNRAFLLWMARNRLNYWCVQQSNHPFLHKLGIQMSCGSHSAQSMFLNPHDAYPYDHPRFEKDEDKPEDPYPVGEHYRGDANDDGTLTYFEAHPEWYPMVDGKRVPGVKGSFGRNYCTSNPHATEEFMKNYVQALVDGPYQDATVVRFWTLDGGKWCQCSRCKALGIPTDRNLLLVHELDQKIKEAQEAGRINRRIILRFLAYADVLHPPTKSLPKSFDYDTCCATFFPIVRCYVHDFDNPGCSKNVRYLKNLKGWATDPDRHYRGQLCIGEYYNVSGYKCLPVCYMHTMASDIPFYHEMGARHFHYMHVVTENWGNKALTNYQMARQLWDPETDCEVLWQDYFARRYGPAAGTMHRFYQMLEKMLCNVSELKYGLARRLNRGAADLFPSTHLKYEKTDWPENDGPDLVQIVGYAEECRKIIDGVLEKELPPRIERRIREDERLFTYGERTVLFYDALARGFRALREDRVEKARRATREARDLADLLRADTTSTKHSSSHANANNALAASRAANALAILSSKLEDSAESER